MRDEVRNALAALEALATMARDAAAQVEKAGDDLKNTSTAAPSEIAEFYFYVKIAYENIDKDIKRVYHVMDMVGKFLLPERLQANGLDAIRVPSIARSFSIVSKTSASFLDKEKGFEWLRSIGQEEVIQETVNAGTLAALCRNLILEQGIDPPADIVKVSTYNTTSMVKYTPKPGA